MSVFVVATCQSVQPAATSYQIDTCGTDSQPIHVNVPDDDHTPRMHDSHQQDQTRQRQSEFRSYKISVFIVATCHTPSHRHTWQAIVNLLMATCQTIITPPECTNLISKRWQCQSYLTGNTKRGQQIRQRLFSSAPRAVP
jgi:S-adenosylmethionine/arginine decarboxylase-like enzyme